MDSSAENKYCDVCMQYMMGHPAFVPNVAVYHGLCDVHRKLSLEMSAPYERHDGLRSAEAFFRSITSRYTPYPIIDLPFATGPHFKFENQLGIKSTGSIIRRGETQQKHTQPILKPLICDKIITAVYRPEICERPIVFLVHSDLPHTGLWILVDGRLFTIGYGYISPPSTGVMDVESILHPEKPKQGTFYSPDLPLVLSSRPGGTSAILWVGVLTPFMLARLQREMNEVREIKFNTAHRQVDHDGDVSVNETDVLVWTPNKNRKQPTEVVVMDDTCRLNLLTQKNYVVSPHSDTPDLEKWNCHKWALSILFGDLHEFFDQSKTTTYGNALMHYDMEIDGSNILRVWWDRYQHACTSPQHLRAWLDILDETNSYFTTPRFEHEWLLCQNDDWFQSLIKYRIQNHIVDNADEWLNLLLKWSPTQSAGRRRMRTSNARIKMKKKVANKTRKTRKTRAQSICHRTKSKRF